MGTQGCSGMRQGMRQGMRIPIGRKTLLGHQYALRADIPQIPLQLATCAGVSRPRAGAKTDFVRTLGLLQDPRSDTSRKVKAPSLRFFRQQPQPAAPRGCCCVAAAARPNRYDLRSRPFNRIQAASWGTFLPLVKQLGVHVQHMDFGGNYLPQLLESEQSLKSLPSNVSLAVTYHSNCGDPWVDSWTRRSRQFEELAYGPTHMNWYERYA